MCFLYLRVGVLVCICTYLCILYRFILYLGVCVCAPEVIVGELLKRVGFHSVVSLWQDKLRNTNRLLSLVRCHSYQRLIGWITSDYITLI